MPTRTPAKKTTRAKSTNSKPTQTRPGSRTESSPDTPIPLHNAAHSIQMKVALLGALFFNRAVGQSERDPRVLVDRCVGAMLQQCQQELDYIVRHYGHNTAGGAR